MHGAVFRTLYKPRIRATSCGWPMRSSLQLRSTAKRCQLRNRAWQVLQPTGEIQAHGEASHRGFCVIAGDARLKTGTNFAQTFPSIRRITLQEKQNRRFQNGSSSGSMVSAVISFAPVGDCARTSSTGGRACGCASVRRCLAHSRFTAKR